MITWRSFQGLTQSHIHNPATDLRRSVFRKHLTIAFSRYVYKTFHRVWQGSEYAFFNCPSEQILVHSEHYRHEINVDGGL